MIPDARSAVIGLYRIHRPRPAAVGSEAPAAVRQARARM